MSKFTGHRPRLPIRTVMRRSLFIVSFTSALTGLERHGHRVLALSGDGTLQARLTRGLGRQHGRRRGRHRDGWRLGANCRCDGHGLYRCPRQPVVLPLAPRRPGHLDFRPLASEPSARMPGGVDAVPAGKTVVTSSPPAIRAASGGSSAAACRCSAGRRVWEVGVVRSITQESQDTKRPVS